MAESYLRDKKRVLACACLCEGEFGVDGLYVGVPCVIGAGGLERIIEIDLNEEEQKAFDASVEHVRTLVSQIEL
jgi:malate dehydrogenase